MEIVCCKMVKFYFENTIFANVVLSLIHLVYEGKCLDSNMFGALGFTTLTSAGVLWKNV